MKMSEKRVERMLFDFCDKLAAGLVESTVKPECLEGYHKIASVINNINAEGFSNICFKVETLCSGTDMYELEILDSGEESTLYATEAEALAQAPKDGTAYILHHSAPKEMYRIVDFMGTPFGDGEIFESRKDATIALLREFVPEWKQAVEHLKEISQPVLFSPEWEEEMREQSREERAMFGSSILTEEAFEANYVHRLILEAQKEAV